MPDLPDSGDTAVLVNLDCGDSERAENLEELAQLAESAGIAKFSVVKGKRPRPDAATYAGSGKIAEIAEVLERTRAQLVIFNHDLSPAQGRNLEQRLGCRVIDRTSLILDIFAQRARSHEGKLQVELAQLEHLATRLVRGWTHLERQKGGIGLRGPGETQLETDRRLLAKRVKVLKDKLAKFKQQRSVRRRQRHRANVTAVSLVGYTNAGKSTLFNALTRSRAWVADQLFATLDTTSRKLFIPDESPVVLSDTVGFIRHLPHTLIAAFRATLEETVQADLLLHLVDANSVNREQQIAEVNKVLDEIGAGAIPQILVFNKIDLNGYPPGSERDEYGNIARVRLSAKTGAGLDLVKQALAEAMHRRVQLAPQSDEEFASCKSAAAI